MNNFGENNDMLRQLARLQPQRLPTTDHKRIGVGQFACKLAGQDRVLKEAARSTPDQLNQTITVLTDQFDVPAPPDLQKARLEDTEAAIAALAEGDDLSAIKRKLAAIAIAAETAAHQSLQVAAVLADNPKQRRETAELKRQSLQFFEQSRKTLKTLADVKQPKQATFVKTQQNLLVADGQAVEPKPKQLGEAHGMECRSQKSRRRKMPTEPAVAVQHRTPDGGREVSKSAE